MSDFRPFVDEDRIEGELLRAAADDRASASARERAREAFERALAAGGGGGGEGGKAPRENGPAPRPSPPAALGPRAPLAAKWIGAGAGSIAAVAGLAGLVALAPHIWPSASSSPAPSPPSTATASTPSVPSVPSAPSAEPAAPAEVPESAPLAPAASAERDASAPSAPAASGIAQARTTASAVPPPSLADEVVALDRARHALSAGDATGAVASLDDYARTFPRGALRETASVLRVEALVKSGQREAAVELARRMLRAHPKSPWAVKLRSLLPDANL